MLAVEIDGFAGQQAAEDGQELAGLLVALVMRQEHAIAGQFHRIAADHHIEQQPAIAQPIERRGLSRRKGRQRHARPQRDEIFEPIGDRREAGRGDPGFFAILPGRQQHAFKAEPVGRLGDLLEIAEIGLPLAAGSSRDSGRRHGWG